VHALLEYRRARTTIRWQPVAAFWTLKHFVIIETVCTPECTQIARLPRSRKSRERFVSI